MSGCREVQAKFTEYLDGRLNGREMQRVAAPPGGLPGMLGEWNSLRRCRSRWRRLARFRSRLTCC